MLVTVFKACFYISSHLTFTTILQGRINSYFINEETEAQRDQGISLVSLI